MAPLPSKSNLPPAATSLEEPDAAESGLPAPKETIKILLLEDDPRDAELVRHALRMGELQFEFAAVDTRAAFVQQLAKSPPDLILSDFALPSFDGYSALEIARAKCPNTPFIFVTGTLGEEVAIKTLKKGATDYVLKHRLSRLVPAVNRALHEARQHAGRRRAEERLRESHEQLRTLSIYLQYVREEERIRIAREVHDELGQALTGLKLQLAWLTHRLPRKLTSLREKARDMAGCIDQTIESVRRIATELRPGVLDNAGLQAAIEWQANQFETQTGIQCRVQADIKETVLDQDLNTAFFRIFQEALTNVKRHAQASHVDVRLMETGGYLVMQVKDNGCGISQAEIHNTKSIGLIGMRERANLVGGEVRVRGEAGKGTTVSVRIPRPPGPLNSARRHENSSHRRPRHGPPRSETDPG
jgi:signal transduction histidine kinase